MLRRKVLSLATALVSLVASGLAGAQETTTPPPAPPPAAAPAPAPAPAAAAGKEEKTEEITVTGSRIRRKDLTTPAPVTVINRDQIQSSGKVSIGDFLQSLPEQGNAINTQINNGGDGSTRVNLRGLGTNRTLVLVNGRRFVPGGTGADSTVDLNSIPTSAIERIEILKDGASAVYGSDAVAGVVNIITRKTTSGTELNAFTGASPQGDGQTYDINVTTGSSNERGGILFNGGFYRMEPVWVGDRKWSEKPYRYSFTTKRVTVGGSIGVPEGVLDLFSNSTADYTGTPTALWNQLVSTYNPTGAAWTESTFIYKPGQGPNGVDWRPFNGLTDTYNFNPENYLVTPQQRISLYAAGDTRFSDVARGYFESSYVNRRSEWKIAPEPLFSDGEGLTLASNNYYNPFGVAFTPATGGIYRRLIEFGRRTEAQDIDTVRVLGGFDGSAPDALGPLGGWFWDVNLNYGRTNSVTVKRGNLYLPNLQAALGPSFLDPADSVVKCGTPGAVISGCVPLDLFHGAGSIRPAQTENLTFTGTHRGYNQLVGVQANASGELFTLMADRPAGLAVGYEYRRLSGAYLFDPITAAGLTTGNKGENTEGNYNVHEGYAEIVIPLVSGMVGVQDLEASAAARAFDYSSFGSDWTYKFGARYRPISDVTVRGTYSTAFRAPSVGEMFSGQADTFPNVSDPCSGVAADGTPAPIAAGTPLYAACGAAVNNGDARIQLRGRQGGNPDLEPETAKIFTAGIVVEPRYVKNLSVTVDYYRLKLDNSISTIGFNVILNSCYTTGQYCGMIQRDPGSQRITNIIDTNTNVGGNETAGIDFSLRYALPSPVGRWGFGFDGNWLHKFTQTFADGSVISGKGNFDLASQGTYGVYPTFKANAGVTWGWQGLGAGINTRYVNGFKECRNNDCANFNSQSRDVTAFNQWDAFVSYGLTSGFGKTSVALGVLNALDEAPPKIYNGFTNSTDPSAYDMMGRFVYVRLTQAY